jgi:hypothetical protein
MYYSRHIAHTFRQNNQTVAAGLNRNVFNYDVRITPDKVPKWSKQNSRHTFTFTLRQLLPNGAHRDMTSDELMKMHDRVVHVVASFLDYTPSSNVVQYWHIHPGNFYCVCFFAICV